MVNRKDERVGVLHLMCGQAASGKTTLARRIEKENQAIRFSKDEWIVALYGRNVRKEEWAALERRCYDLIFEMTRKLLERGIDVILDHGFWYETERREARVLAESVGARAIVYYLDVSDDIRRKRLLDRNLRLCSDSVEVTLADFDSQLAWFERPAAEEGIAIVQVGPHGNLAAE